MTPLGFDPHSDRIQLAHKRLSDAYHRVPGAETPVVEPGARRPAVSYTEKDVLADFDKMLEASLAWAGGLASTDNDWSPMINTYCGVVMVAEAFGCPVVFDPFGTAWTHPAITDISQVWNLKPVPPQESPMIRRLSEWIDFAQRKIGTETQYWTEDIQSPFSVAARVVESEELLAACISDPDAVHHLCRMITDYSILMMREHIAEMEHPAFPGRNFPSISENVGICIADDTPLIMLSPAMYREFALPYNAMIGEAFGGIHIHSCGDYRHNLGVLLETPNLKSIQLHAGVGEFPLPETATEDCAFNRARTQVACLVDSSDISRGDEYRGRGADHHREYILPRLCQTDITGLILQTPGVGPGIPDSEAALKWTRRELAEAQLPLQRPV